VIAENSTVPMQYMVVRAKDEVLAFASKQPRLETLRW